MNVMTSLEHVRAPIGPGLRRHSKVLNLFACSTYMREWYIVLPRWWSNGRPIAGDGGRAGTSSDGPPCSWTLPSGSVVDISSWSAQGCGASTSLHSFDCARHLSADLVAWICWSFQFAHSGPRDSIGEWLNSLVPLSLLTRVDNCPRPDTLCFLSL